MPNTDLYHRQTIKYLCGPMVVDGNDDATAAEAAVATSGSSNTLQMDVDGSSSVLRKPLQAAAITPTTPAHSVLISMATTIDGLVRSLMSSVVRR